jgi:hypothetical protein
VRPLHTPKWQILVFVFTILAGSGLASPITGIFDGGGTATVDLFDIFFCPNGQTPSGADAPTACSAASGNISLSGGTGSFLPINAGYGSASTILSLNSASEPLNTLVNVPNFVVLNPTVGAPNIAINLTEVLAGSFLGNPLNCPAGAAAGGQICTPAGSAFNLINSTATTSSATFTLDITATDGIAADKASGTAVFTAQFGVPYQTVLAALTSGGGTGNYSSTYSATFTLEPSATTPEPMTFLLTGVGLLVVGILGRRRIKT